MVKPFTLVNYNPAESEIVVVMTKADWDYLLTLLADAHLQAQSAKPAGRIAGLVKRLAHKADHLTLTWLDRQLEQFP